MHKKPLHNDLTCENCGNPFRSNLPTAAYCSNACRQAAYRLRHAMPKRPGWQHRGGRPRKYIPERCNEIPGGSNG